MNLSGDEQTIETGDVVGNIDVEDDNTSGNRMNAAYGAGLIRRSLRYNSNESMERLK